MPLESYRSKLRKAYMTYMSIRQLMVPPVLEPGEDEVMYLARQLKTDLEVLKTIERTRYLRERSPVPKAGSLHLAWEFAKDPAHHHRFRNMLRVSPLVFDILIDLIKDHPVFQNNSNRPQAPVDIQLAVTLYRMGRNGNGVSVMDVARNCAISEGSVELYTDRCFTAILSLHAVFVRPLTPEEKEVEKEWVDAQVGFKGLWREGWIMYDGTIVVVFARPGHQGDAYYTRKSNYGFNVQVRPFSSTYRVFSFTYVMVD